MNLQVGKRDPSDLELASKDRKTVLRLHCLVFHLRWEHKCTDQWGMPFLGLGFGV